MHSENNIRAVKFFIHKLYIFIFRSIEGIDSNTCPLAAVFQNNFSTCCIKRTIMLIPYPYLSNWNYKPILLIILSFILFLILSFVFCCIPGCWLTADNCKKSGNQKYYKQYSGNDTKRFFHINKASYDDYKTR